MELFEESTTDNRNKETLSPFCRLSLFDFCSLNVDYGNNERRDKSPTKWRKWQKMFPEERDPLTFPFFSFSSSFVRRAARKRSEIEINRSKVLSLLKLKMEAAFDAAIALIERWRKNKKNQIDKKIFRKTKEKEIWRRAIIESAFSQSPKMKSFFLLTEEFHHWIRKRQKDWTILL